jgi:hypothetical protein
MGTELDEDWGACQVLERSGVLKITARSPSRDSRAMRDKEISGVVVCSIRLTKIGCLKTLVKTFRRSPEGSVRQSEEGREDTCSCERTT